MRVSGKIVSWNEDKGFGFVAPSSGGKQIFLHVSEINGSLKYFEEGQGVSYIPSTDKDGRPCGKSILLDGERIAKKSFKKGSVFSFSVLILFISFASYSYYAGNIPQLIINIYLFFSLIAYIAYAKDKSAAKKGLWRTKESTLHFLSLVGGWPGAIVAQQRLRHKTKKKGFRFVFWVTVLLNFGGFYWLQTLEGSVALQVWMVELEVFFL